MEEQILITPVDPITFELQDYSVQDSDIIAKFEVDTVFSQSIDYIEYFIFDETENLIYPSTTILNEDIVSSTNEFIQYRNQSNYFVDFYLNFGSNNLVIANNISLDNSIIGDPTILIKLYEPLPTEFDLKSQLWVVEQISTPQSYQVNFPFTPFVLQDFQYMIITDEPVSRCNDAAYNYLVMVDNVPSRFVYLKYKTKDDFGNQDFDVNDDLKTMSDLGL